MLIASHLILLFSLPLPLILALSAITVRKKNSKHRILICSISVSVSALWLIYLFLISAVVAVVIAILLVIIFGIIAIVKKDRNFLIGIAFTIAAIVLAYIVGVVMMGVSFTGMFGPTANNPDTPNDPDKVTTVALIPGNDNEAQMELDFIYVNNNCYVNGCSWSGGSFVEPSTCFDEETGTLTIPEYSPNGERVVGIYSWSFHEMHELKKVILPSSVKTISEEAFRNCTNLKTINLENVEYIGDSAFANCTSLEPDNTSYFSYPRLSNIKSIGGQAFYNCQKLKTFDLGSELESIGEWAFASSGVISIEIPESVATMGDRVFGDCERLQSVGIKSPYLTELPSGTFANCTSLISVAFVDGLETIGDNAFCGSGIEWITLPDTVRTIKKRAFYCCNNLSRIMISESMTVIENDAFWECPSLLYVYWRHSESERGNDVRIRDGNDDFLNAHTHYYDLGGFDFSSNGDGTCSIYATGNNERTQIVIPYVSPAGELVTDITDGVFINNYNLTTVTIPLTIETIGGRAFSGCGSLKKIIYEGTQESWQTISIGSQNEALRRITPDFLGVEIATPEDED